MAIGTHVVFYQLNPSVKQMSLECKVLFATVHLRNLIWPLLYCVMSEYIIYNLSRACTRSEVCPGNRYGGRKLRPQLFLYTVWCPFWSFQFPPPLRLVTASHECAGEKFERRDHM